MDFQVGHWVYVTGDPRAYVVRALLADDKIALRRLDSIDITSHAHARADVSYEPSQVWTADLARTRVTA